ncbi:MAG: hypothetical protein JSS16_03080 [Proteobacteria bacterium]|uniref:YncE family protein n=1 Tax=Rudaea sp. TaxID=2136325 RepID=UPI001DF65411|nr:hypothetical protein [Pseudomonadota bacterium]MBS0568928.1 hypothetical protein [Pseudomonadota bacterium]
MKPKIHALAAALAFILPVLAFADGPAPLKPLGRTDMPGYDGDFDHFGADVKGDRLFLAGEEGGELDVFNLHSGAHLKTVKGMEEPHAIYYDANKDRIFLSNSGNGLTHILDGKTYAQIGTVKLIPGADVMYHDPSTNRLWFVVGGKNAPTKLPKVTVAQVDPETGKTVSETQFDTDFTEGIIAEQHGSHVYVNVAGLSEIAVLDKKTGKVLSTWPVKEGQNNSAIDLDEKNKRLFIITRKPFKLVVVNTDNGQSVASFDAPGRTNGLIFDAANRRIYACGDDYTGVFAQRDADHYVELARVPTEKGAKTCFLAPEVGQFYLAVGGAKDTKAGLLRYAVVPGDAK